VPAEPELFPGMGEETEMATKAVENGISAKEAPPKEASLEAPERAAPVTRTVEPERKIARTQSAPVASLIDSLDQAEPDRMTDVPVATREEIEAGRQPAESVSRDMTRTAVAEGVREYERQQTGNTRRTGARSFAAAPGVARGKSEPRPLFAAATPAPDDVPKAIRPEVQSAASVVGPSPESMPEEHRVNGVIEVREECAAPEQVAQTKGDSREAMQAETRENVQPDGKEKAGIQPRTVGSGGAVGTDGESPDKAAGRSPLSHVHTSAALLRADGVRVVDGGTRMPEYFQTLPPDTARDVVDQVVKGLALKVQGGLSEVRIRLEPESLGEVVVSMRMENGKLQAQIDVSQAGLKGVLDGNLAQLRQSLSMRGIEVQRLDVVFSGGSGTRGSEGGQGERQRRYGGRQPLAAEAVEQYQTGRLLGYNTMEMVM
jgi:flagellar hook-length control protein FliK